MVVACPSRMTSAIAADDQAALDSLLRLVDAVSTAVPPGLQALRHRVTGILALRAGDLDEAESGLRAAIEGFDAWGAGPYKARAQAELRPVFVCRATMTMRRPCRSGRVSRCAPYTPQGGCRSSTSRPSTGEGTAAMTRCHGDALLAAEDIVTRRLAF